MHFFFITEKKREILNNTITVFNFFKSKQFYKILILGFFGCLTLSITFKIIGIINLELTMIFLVGFIQLFNALSLLLIENFFWKKNYYMIIVVDFIFWISIILLFYLLRDILIIKGAYLILNIFLLIRIIFYLYLSKYK